MKAFIIILFCLTLGSGFSQSFGENIPVDSADYMALIDKNGTVQTDWKRLDDIEIRTLDRLYIGKYLGKYGILDSCLEWRLPPRYSSIAKKGDYIIAENYDELTVFNKSLDSITFFSTVTEIDYDPIYSTSSDIESEYEARIIIKTKNGTGIADKDYNWIVEPKYADAFFDGTIIYIRNGEQFGFMASNSTIVEPSYTSIGRFNSWILELEDETGHPNYFLSNAKAIPHTDSTLIIEDKSGLIKIYENGKAELYNHDLKQVVNYSGEDIFTLSPYNTIWNKGYTKKSGQEIYAVKKNGKVGIIDKNNRIIIPHQYENINWGGEDHFIVMIEGKFGVIDKSGNEVIAPEYTYLKRDRDLFKVYKYNLKGYLDLNGEIVMPCEFNNIHINSGGFLAQKNGKLGFYKIDGKPVLAHQFERAYHHNGGLELVRNGKRTMVNENGLISLTDCDKISSNGQTVKYYKGGKVYVHYLENGMIVDTTVYDMDKIITIHNRWTNAHPIGMSESPCATFTYQQNGKIGSLNKNTDGFSIYPRFDNVIDVGSFTMVNVKSDDFINVDKSFISSKEVLMYFDGASGVLGEQIVAYLAPGNFRGSHTSALDPCITKEKKWRYYSTNKFGTIGYKWMYNRSGFSSIASSEGEISLTSGQDMKPYKEIYTAMNEGYNLKISSKYEFERMSNSPMVKIENPKWQILNIAQNGDYKKIGVYDYIQILPSSNIIYREDELYGILHRQEEPLLEPIAKEIEVVNRDEFEFYLVQIPVTDSLDNESYEWTVYNFGGQVLPATYDKVEVITKDYFKVTKNGNTTLVNKEGDLIWTYAFPEFVSEN